MVNGNALNSYQKAQMSADITPEKLILMLYEGAIKRINLAREGVKHNDPKQRGENIGKAIAIISELNACLDSNIQTDEINFLRSLYMTMMNELAKVSVSNDIATLDRAEKYTMELKRIWETTVMNQPAESEDAPAAPLSPKPFPGYGAAGYGQNASLRTSIAV